MVRSNYRVIANEEEKVVLVCEGPWDIYKTITNDAALVVEDLINLGILTQDKRLFYFDSEGILTEIILDVDRKFSGFMHVKNNPEGVK